MSLQLDEVVELPDDFGDKTLAEKCVFSAKQVKNRSVFCNRLDQWISISYCQYACTQLETNIPRDKLELVCVHARRKE